MKITDVRVRKVNDEGKMKAVVSVTFDDEFVVHDIKIIEGQNGLFIAMPSRKMGEGDFRDIAHPLVSETRNKIKDAIFAEYEKVLGEKVDVVEVPKVAEVVEAVAVVEAVEAAETVEAVDAVETAEAVEATEEESLEA
jgi:stage V sporulation protein G